MMSKQETTVISLGGSLIVPDDIDVAFLRNFTFFIKEQTAAGQKFVLITGGGKVCRRYQAAATELGIASQEENDWVGIHVTRLNGQFLRIILGQLAHGEVITDPADLKSINEPVTVAAGWKPGWSTDYDAVEMAKTVGAKRVINLSNVDYVYDKDPKTFPEAKKIEKIEWAEFRKLIPKKWAPGLNSPFDPMAAKIAEENNIEVVFMNGRDTDNIKKYLDGKSFIGTLIK
jgi:uridylate kinase